MNTSAKQTHTQQFYTDVMAGLLSRAGTPEMTMSDTLDMGTISMTIWVPRS